MPRAALVLLALAALPLAACGGSGGPKGNGEAAKPAAQIVADAEAAATAATSVHVSGSGSSGGTKLVLDLRLVSGKGAKGHLLANGLSFDLVRIGGTAYLRGGRDFWRRFAGGLAAALLEGRWLKAPARRGQLSSLTSLTSIRSLFSQLLGAHGTLQKTGETTIDGVAVVGVRDRKAGGTLYVATSGRPFPIALRKTGQGAIRFDAWNAPVALTAPAHAVDISKLTG